VYLVTACLFTFTYDTSLTLYEGTAEGHLISSFLVDKDEDIWFGDRAYQAGGEGLFKIEDGNWTVFEGISIFPDDSEPVEMVHTGMERVAEEDILTPYPNPFSASFQIDVYSDIGIEIFLQHGRHLFIYREAQVAGGQVPDGFPPERLLPALIREIERLIGNIEFDRPGEFGQVVDAHQLVAGKEQGPLEEVGGIKMAGDVQFLPELLHGLPAEAVQRPLPEFKPPSWELGHPGFHEVFIAQQDLPVAVDDQGIYPYVEVLYLSHGASQTQYRLTSTLPFNIHSAVQYNQ
jgi:hypothetical protein